MRTGGSGDATGKTRSVFGACWSPSRFWLRVSVRWPARRKDRPKTLTRRPAQGQGLVGHGHGRLAPGFCGLACRMKPAAARLCAVVRALDVSVFGRTGDAIADHAGLCVAAEAAATRTSGLGAAKPPGEGGPTVWNSLHVRVFGRPRSAGYCLEASGAPMPVKVIGSFT